MWILFLYIYFIIKYETELVEYDVQCLKCDKY